MLPIPHFLPTLGWLHAPVTIRHRIIPPRNPALPIAKGIAITADGAAKQKIVMPACIHPI